MNEDTASVIQALDRLTNAVNTLSITTALSSDGPLRNEALWMVAALITDDRVGVERIMDDLMRRPR